MDTSTDAPLDVRITDASLGRGRGFDYHIWVNGKPYDSFQSKTPLTLGEQIDAVAGYREGLTGEAPRPGPRFTPAP